MFAEWAKIGVPVGLFPSWLRCSDLRCNRLARADAGFFELLGHAFSPDKVRYVNPRELHQTGANLQVAC